MVKRLGLLVLCWLWAASAAAQRVYPDDRDVVEFYNDDRLIGKIKSLQRGELVFSADKIDDDVTLKLQDIRRIQARRKPYKIEDIQGNIYFGTLEFNLYHGKVDIVQASDTSVLYIEDLDNLFEMDANFWKRLQGSASVGYSFTRSSNIGRITGSNSLQYTTRRWVWRLDGDIIYTMDEEFKGIEKADLSVGGYIEFLKHFFGVSQIQYQRITELGVSARVLGTLGGGPILLKNRHNDLRLATGASVQREYADDSTTANSSSLEIPLYFNYYYYKFGTPQLVLQVNNNLYFSTTQAGRWRMDLNTTLSWKIISHLNTSFQVYSNYDSKPLDATAAKLDYGVVFSVGYSW
ncbi:DUF481 domain-containing protein [Chitinophaga lutea]